MLEPVVLQRAEEDIYHLILFGAQEHGIEATRAYVETLRARIVWLCQHPGAGPVHDSLSGGIRSFRQGSHHIYYQTDAARLTVIRVLHARSDVDRNFT